MLINWLPAALLSSATRTSRRAAARRARSRRQIVEQMECRTLLTVNLGTNFVGPNPAATGGASPPNPMGAEGPQGYVAVVDQTLAMYSSTGTLLGSTDTLTHFMESATVGNLPPTSATSVLSQPMVAYDESIQRFVIGVEDVDTTAHTSNFDIAVSKTNNPTDLTAASWNFYQISTINPVTATDDASYNGNFGYNHDAFVIALNELNGSAPDGSLVLTINATDLMTGAPTPQSFLNIASGVNLRPTAMHNSSLGDPMWFVMDNGDGLHITVYKELNQLSKAAVFTPFTLNVNAFANISTNPPTQPGGSVIGHNLDSRILSAAESANTLVAAQSVSNAAKTADTARWYSINIASGTPVITQQGNVGFGPNTYAFDPSIDINPLGDIGMSFLETDTTATGFLSMWVTGRQSTDAVNTMQTPVKIPSGTGTNVYGDLSSNVLDTVSSINLDPNNGSFWTAGEWATSGLAPNWGTAVTNFSMEVLAPTLTIPAGSVTYTSGVGAVPVPLGTGAQVTDLGAATFNGGNLVVQNTTSDVNDRLQIATRGGITTGVGTVSYLGNQIGTFSGGAGSGPLVVLFTSTNATAAAVQALVQAIDFFNVAAVPVGGTRTVNFTVRDALRPSPTVPVLVNVKIAGPVIDFSTVTPSTYTAGGSAILLAPTSALTDTGTSNFFGNGGQLDVTVTGNASPTDQLSFQVGGQITTSGNSVYFNGNNFATFTGNNSTSLVFNFDSAFATTQAVQALIQAITFHNSVLTPSTQTRTVSFKVVDSQPVTSPTVTTTVNVQLSVPTITLAGPAPLTFTENGPPVLIAAGATVTEPLATLMNGQLAVTITGNSTTSDQLLIQNQGTGAGQIGVAGSVITYGGLTIGTFTGGQAGSPLTVTFTTANATAAAAQALVQDIAFNNTSANPSTLQRTIKLQIFDSQPASSTPVNVLMNVVMVDNAPIINLNSVIATYTEGNPPVTLATGATVSYSSGGNFVNGSLTVSLPNNGTPSDQLLIQALGGITTMGSNVLFNGNVIGTFTGGANGNPLTVLFTNTNATVPASQALIRAIGFSNNSIAPSTLPRTALFVINDGQGNVSNPVTMTVSVIGADNPPTLVLGPSLPYLSNTPPGAIASAATVTDPDSPFFTGGSLTVTEAAGSLNDVLTVINQGKGANQISVSGANVFDANTLIGTITSFGSSVSPLSISLNASASVADVQDLVRAIGFGINGSASSQTRGFTFTLNDGGGAASVSQVTSVAVNVGNVPAVVVLQPSVNYAAGSPPVTVSPNATVSDPDSLTLNGGSLAISIAQGVTINDLLTIQSQGSGLGQVLVSGLNVYYSGTLVGTLNAGGGVGLDPLVVTFNQQSSPAAAQAILSAVQFSTTGPNSAGPRLLQAILIDDSQLPSTPAFEQINVSLPVNPVAITLSSPSMNYLRGSGPTFIDAGATFTDVTAGSFAHGTLRFGVHGGTKNHVAIANTIDIQLFRGRVRFDGVLIGTLKGGVVHLNASATAPAVQALIRAVTFSTNGSVGIRSATFAFNDGHGGQAFAAKTIVVS